MSRTWVFLRGLSREQRHWEPFLSQFKNQCAEDTVICLDLPGAGILHDVAPPIKISEYPPLMRDQLLNQTDHSAIFVAMSMGGIDFSGMGETVSSRCLRTHSY